MTAKYCTGLHSLTAVITSATAWKKLLDQSEQRLLHNAVCAQSAGVLIRCFNLQYVLKIKSNIN